MGDPSAASPQTVSAAGWLAIVAAYLVVPLILLVTGRDPGWWQAWAFSLGVLVAGVGGRALAERRHPGLQADRMRLGRGQEVEPWDRVLAPLMALSLLYLPVIVGGLDHRQGWTPPFPVWANVVGLLLCALGYGYAVWALVENRFFTSMVRIQTERGHEVCDSGPYRFVRHPGYAGNLLGVLGIPLALDSLWAFVAAGVAIAISLARTLLEDRTLMEKLPGYREYARRVRFRLLPGVW
ncbi:MAG: isoprenylcysteine carboxylmethyltransferase family protein [Myxococcota bacterium]|nr:isoprenylcysteine carboxylmethyltransferase family protein [Myxococcota bacterium]